MTNLGKCAELLGVKKFNYLCIDMTKNQNEGNYRIFNESKTTYIDCVPETEPFKKHIRVDDVHIFCKQSHSHSFKCCIQLETWKIYKNSKELVSLENQIKVARLQDKIGKLNFHEAMDEVFEPVSKSCANTSQDITKTVKEASIKNNQSIENLNNKLLEILNDRGLIATYLLSPLAKITNSENSTQFKFVKDFT